MGNLVWIDTETDGLKIGPYSQILEFGCLITDANLKVLDSYNAIIHASDEVLANMTPWCIDQHGKSGLTQACRASKITQEMAETAALALITKYTAPKESALWGNSVGHDRKFMDEFMPKITEHLHYREGNVSAYKLIAQLWFPSLPPYKKKETHRTLDDIRESIGELSYYLDEIFKDRQHFIPGLRSL